MEGEVNDNTILRTTEQCICNTISATVINCLSIKSNKASFIRFVDTYTPNIIFCNRILAIPFLVL